MSPPGYSQLAGQSGTELSKENESNRLIIKKSWDLALGPLKQVYFTKIVLRKLLVNILYFIGTNEFVYYVYGWKFNFNISDHDGWHVNRTTSKSIILTTNK